MTLELAPNPRVLFIVLRRLGDVLLTTPLIRSLKRAYPDAAIDALVFAGTEGILAGNPDLSSVITMPPQASVRETLALGARLWRRYHLAISTQTGDRPTGFAWAAGRRRIGLTEADGFATRLKQRALGQFVVTDPELHRVADLLRLADMLGIEEAEDIVLPAGPVRDDLRPARPYAVIHAVPMFRYKRWHEEGWRALAAALAARGLAVIATGGPADADRQYLDGVWNAHPEVRRLDGVLSWGELAALIGGAAVYVGPDTSVTHLAAATGAPTVALYGPTDPRLFGPWPAGGLADPWVAAGTIQRRGNVWLVQNPLPCLPCQQEGCARHRESFSQCLDELSPAQVLAAVDEALSPLRAGGSASG
jgi:heptosyltransferase III